MVKIAPRALSVALLLSMLVTLGVTRAEAETISGTVTNASASPLASVSVAVYNATTNTQVTTAFTNASGAYSTASIPAGSYFVRTFNSAHYINQLYHSAGNLPCVGTCNINAGTPVVVPSGGTAAGINFSLSAGATISGTITDESTLAPISGIPVEIRNITGVFVERVTTNASGQYVTANGFPTELYFVKTDDNGTGYINEAYPNIPCLVVTECPLLSATAVTATAGATTPNIDIAVRRGGRVSGHITRTTGSPLVNGAAGVSVLSAAGQTYAFGSVDGSGTGAYITGRGLPGGVYTVSTFNSQGLFNQSVALITVTEGTTTTGVDFVLDAGGQISGTVRDSSGLPLPNVDIQILNSNGGSVATALSNASGVYTTSQGIQAGIYFARTNSFATNALPGYVHVLYPNISCSAGCTATLGTPINVFAGATTSGIDFVLERGGRIGGTVTDAATGAPVFNAPVAVLNAVGTVVSSGSTDATGRFVTVAGLPPADYFLRTLSNSGYIGEIWPNIPCVGNLCPSGGSPISVTAGTITNINAELVLGARFRGNVMNAQSGAAVTGAAVSALDAIGQTLAFASVDPLGNYIIGPGFPAGSYYARTSNSLGYLNELYDNVPCNAGCLVTTGTAIALSGTTITGNVNFGLTLGGRVTGHITNVGGSPLSGIAVSMFNPLTNASVTAISDAAGNYSVLGLADGTYYARTSNSSGYINQAYPDIPCVFICSITTLGTPIVVSGGATVTSIDFILRLGGRVTGTITDDVTGLPLSGVFVSIVDASGLTASSGLTDASGNYLTTAGIASGTYYALESNGLGYFSELYDNIRCVGACTVASGNPLSITEGGVVGNVNFGLSKGGRISGRITDAGSGAPLQSVGVNVLDSTGRSVGFGFTDGSGNYIVTTALQPGTYFARTTNGLGFIDELYNDKPCPLNCPITGGTPILVIGTDTTTGIDFALTRGGRISGVVTDAATGQPIGGVSISIYDSTGTLITSAATGPFGLYTSSAGLPPGTYFARTSNNLGYLNSLYSNIPCPGTCSVTQGTPIAVSGNATTNGIDFQLVPGARVSGHVTDTSGNPLRNVSVAVVDTSGAVLSTGITNAAGDYITTQGLPPGTYFVRTFNSIGYVDQLLKMSSSINCLGACDVTAGSTITLAAGTLQSGVNFQLPIGARVQGVVRRTDATPIPNVTISIRDASNTEVSTAVTDANGVYLTGTGLPTGNYFAVTQNAQGLVNKIFNDVVCAISCVPTVAGTPIPLTAGATTAGIDFILTPDGDLDADGIFETIDTQPAVPSLAFSDVPQGGSTSGTIVARNGWTLQVSDISPGGVQLQIAGSGTAAGALVDVCPAGGAERATLDVAGEAATVSCDAATQTHATLRALAASPTIQFQSPATGPGVIVSLTTGQAVTMGSPVTAAASNTQPIFGAIVDASQQSIGSFSLDPAESAEVIVSGDGGVIITVLIGTVTFEVRGTSVTLNPGQSHEFASPVMTVSIDIKPGSDPPTINLKAGGTIPVAILGSSQFDVATIVLASIRFEDATAAMNKNGKAIASFIDVNGDGSLDLLVNFEIDALSLTTADTQGVLEGETQSHQRFRGVDGIRVVK